MFSKGRMPALLSLPFVSKFLAKGWNPNLLSLFSLLFRGFRKEWSISNTKWCWLMDRIYCKRMFCLLLSRSSSMYLFHLCTDATVTSTNYESVHAYSHNYWGKSGGGFYKYLSVFTKFGLEVHHPSFQKSKNCIWKMLQNWRLHSFYLNVSILVQK